MKEFEFSRLLFDYLDKNGIEIVYVSFDKVSEDNLWKTKINENKLFGNHIRASKQLQDSLTTLIWGGIDASPPSSGLKLFEEIEFDLKPK